MRVGWIIEMIQIAVKHRDWMNEWKRMNELMNEKLNSNQKMIKEQWWINTRRHITCIERQYAIEH